MFIAADESDFGRGYLVIGTVWLRNEQIPELERTVAEFRVKNHFWREVHLANVDNTSGEFYNNNCLEFLRIGVETGVEFKCIVVPEAQVNMGMHDNNPKIMQLNFLCTLIRNKLRTEFSEVEEEITILSDSFMPPGTEIERTEIKVDSENPTVFRLEKVSRRAIPEAKVRAERYIGRKIDCMAQCSSHLSSAVQLADLFAGAVSARAAGVSEDDPRWPIVNEFETSYGQKLNQRSMWGRRKLNIWVWRPPAILP